MNIVINPLCHAFYDISANVYYWIRRSSSIRLSKRYVRGGQIYASESQLHLRETTLTDYVLLRLGETTRALVFSLTQPAELKLGADFEVWFQERGRYLGLRVQAKIAGHDGQVRKLHYVKNGVSQADSLIGSSPKGCSPLYLIYVGPQQDPNKPTLESVRSHCRYPLPTGRRRGVWGIRADQVKKLGSRKSTTLECLRSHLFPWECIVCCGTSHGTPTLDDIKEQVIQLKLQTDAAGDVVTQKPPKYVDELRRLAQTTGGADVPAVTIDGSLREGGLCGLVIIPLDPFEF